MNDGFSGSGILGALGAGFDSRRASKRKEAVMKLYELIVAELLAVVIAVILSDKNAYEKAHADLSQLIKAAAHS